MLQKDNWLDVARRQLIPGIAILPMRSKVLTDTILQEKDGIKPDLMSSHNNRRLHDAKIGSPINTNESMLDMSSLLAKNHVFYFLVTWMLHLFL